MGMSIYYIDIKRKSRNTAGAKAPNDIAELCPNSNAGLSARKTRSVSETVAVDGLHILLV